jgi:hypothetical protein
MPAFMADNIDLKPLNDLFDIYNAPFSETKQFSDSGPLVFNGPALP